MAPPQKTLFRLFAVLIVGLVAALPAQAADVGLDGIDIDLLPDDIDVGDSFTVNVTLENADATDSSVDVDVEIYAGDLLVHEDTIDVALTEGNDTWFTVSSSSFEVDNDDIWKERLLAYDCGGHAIEVRVAGDVTDHEDDASLSIDGYEFERFSIDPESPGPGDTITVSVADRHGDDLANVDVVVTHLGDNDEWDFDDERYEDDTDNNGELEFVTEDIRDFEDEPHGSYEFVIYDNEYCKESEPIDVVRSLTITGPFPATPSVGEQFQIRVQDQSGDPVRNAKVVANVGRERKQAFTDLEGYARFTVNEAGRVELVVSEEDFEGDVIKAITIAELPEMQVSVSPATPKTGTPASIAVTASGKPVSGATVSITAPDGTSKSQLTGASGITSYTPLQPGLHRVRVEESRHQSADATFTAEKTLKTFKLFLSPRKPGLGDDVTVEVKDAQDLTVAGATVEVSGPLSLSGTTSSSGTYAFTPTKQGRYTLTVSKEDYAAASTSFTPAGELALAISPETPTIGQEVSITVTGAIDGEPVPATITVKNTDGDELAAQTASQMNYTPKESGIHTATATAVNYKDAEEAFTVDRLTAILEAAFDEDTLRISAMRGDEPLANLTLRVTSPLDDTTNVTTNVDGLALYNATEEGTYIVELAEHDIYEAEAIDVVYEEGDYWWLLLIVIFLMVLIIVGILAILYLGAKKRGTDLRIGDLSSLTDRFKGKAQSPSAGKNKPRGLGGI